MAGNIQPGLLLTPAPASSLLPRPRYTEELPRGPAAGPEPVGRELVAKTELSNREKQEDANCKGTECLCPQTHTLPS